MVCVLSGLSLQNYAGDNNGSDPPSVTFPTNRLRRDIIEMEFSSASSGFIPSSNAGKNIFHIGYTEMDNANILRQF